MESLRLCGQPTQLSQPNSTNRLCAVLTACKLVLQLYVHLGYVLNRNTTFLTIDSHRIWNLKRNLTL